MELSKKEIRQLEAIEQNQIRDKTPTKLKSPVDIIIIDKKKIIEINKIGYNDKNNNYITANDTCIQEHVNIIKYSCNDFIYEINAANDYMYTPNLINKFDDKYMDFIDINCYQNSLTDEINKYENEIFNTSLYGNNYILDKFKKLFNLYIWYLIDKKISFEIIKKMLINHYEFILSEFSNKINKKDTLKNIYFNKKIHDHNSDISTDNSQSYFFILEKMDNFIKTNLLLCHNENDDKCKILFNNIKNLIDAMNEMLSNNYKKFADYQIFYD